MKRSVVVLGVCMLLCGQIVMGELLCSLTLDRHAKPARPYKMPGVDYAALAVKARAFATSGERVFTADHLLLEFAANVTTDTRAALSMAAQLVSFNYDMDSSLVISASVVEIDFLNPTLLGQATTNRNGSDPAYMCQVNDVNGGPTVSASSLYRLQTNLSCDVNSTDISVEMSSNSAVPWYRGLDGEPEIFQIDMVTVAMHELTHGFGFASGVDSNGTSNTQLDACGVGVNCAAGFDRLLERNDGTAYDPTGDATFMTAFYTSNDLFFVPPGGSPQPTQKINASSPFVSGSTASHWDQNIPTPAQCTPATDVEELVNEVKLNYPNCNGLMKASIGTGVAIHVLGANTINLLSALGYTMRNCSTFSNCTTCLQVGCEWCYTDGYCGDRTGGELCSDAYQWVSVPENCEAGNLVCQTPGANSPDDVADLLDPQTLSVQCPAAQLSSFLLD